MIHVVLPTYNRRDRLLRCLGCLSAQRLAHRVIVSDSGSSDGSREAVQAAFPHAVVLDGHPGLFWTGAVNLGLRRVRKDAAPGDRFLLLNDDTVFAPDYLEALMACAGAGKRRVVGSVCVDRATPGVIEDGGVSVNWWTAAVRVHGRGEPLASYPPGFVRMVSVLPGRGTLFPVSVLEEVGLPDEAALPHYGADYEYARRCARAGYELVVCYDAVVEGDRAATGIHARSDLGGLVGARDYFFGRKSACNLGDRYRFARLTARGPVQGAVFCAATMARVAARFVRPGRKA